MITFRAGMSPLDLSYSVRSGSSSSALVSPSVVWNASPSLMSSSWIDSHPFMDLAALKFFEMAAIVSSKGSSLGGSPPNSVGGG